MQIRAKWLAGLTIPVALATSWPWIKPSLAESENPCPQASLDRQARQVNFLKLPNWPDAHFYTLMVEAGQSTPKALAIEPTGNTLPAQTGWLYFIAAHQAITQLADFNYQNDSRGATFVQSPLPDDENQNMKPTHWDWLPKDALVCSLRL